MVIPASTNSLTTGFSQMTNDLPTAITSEVPIQSESPGYADTGFDQGQLMAQINQPAAPHRYNNSSLGNLPMNNNLN